MVAEVKKLCCETGALHCSFFNFALSCISTGHVKGPQNPLSHPSLLLFQWLTWPQTNQHISFFFNARTRKLVSVGLADSLPPNHRLGMLQLSVLKDCEILRCNICSAEQKTQWLAWPRSDLQSMVVFCDEENISCLTQLQTPSCSWEFHL